MSILINLFNGIMHIAAVLGDAVNYHIGKKLGNKILEKES